MTTKWSATLTKQRVCIEVRSKCKTIQLSVNVSILETTNLEKLPPNRMLHFPEEKNRIS